MISSLLRLASLEAIFWGKWHREVKRSPADRDRGVKSPKIRGGVKILNFQGPPKLTAFYKDPIEYSQFGGQKSKSSRGNFRGEFPPSSFRYVLTPAIPVSESPLKT